MGTPQLARWRQAMGLICPDSRPKLLSSPFKATAAVQAIHDMLYLDNNDGVEFYNGAKEWSVDMLEAIAEIVGAVIPRPSDAKVCEECRNLIPELDGGDLANRHHDESCSLYEASNE